MLDLQGRTEYFTREDVIQGGSFDYYEGKILVFGDWKMDEFHKPFQNPENQLFYAIGGFGCSPITMGRAVSGMFLSDGENTRFNRGDFLGVLHPDLVEKYKLNEVVESLRNE
jgi:hypothetical protein